MWEDPAPVIFCKHPLQRNGIFNPFPHFNFDFGLINNVPVVREGAPLWNQEHFRSREEKQKSAHVPPRRSDIKID
jgi:hypothetical protein